jgi:hypothetical protein
VTRMFSSPATVVDVVNFRKRYLFFKWLCAFKHYVNFHSKCLMVIFFFNCRLIDYLTRGIRYTSLLRTTRCMPISYTLGYLRDYPVRSLAELKHRPELGLFIVNARICDLISFDPWWYPICKCHRIFDIYWENLLLLQSKFYLTMTF